jgi:hypothetical protein
LFANSERLNSEAAVSSNQGKRVTKPDFIVVPESPLRAVRPEKVLEAAMRLRLVICMKVFALTTIGAFLWPDISFAEKMNVATAKQLCNTARGTFIREHNGKYSCTFPSSYNMGLQQETTFLNCTARGECEYVTFCGGRICHRHSGSAGKGSEKKPPPKPKPTKLEGPTTVTAGTAADRGFGPAGGAVSGANTPAFGGVIAPSATTPSASGAPALNKPAATGKIGVAKPDSVPSQLAERLRRLQQPQR